VYLELKAFLPTDPQVLSESADDADVGNRPALRKPLKNSLRAVNKNFSRRWRVTSPGTEFVVLRRPRAAMNDHEQIFNLNRRSLHSFFKADAKMFWLLYPMEKLE
jgi:hypothetical protein